MMSSEIFENTEEDLRAYTEDIKRKLESQIPRLKGEERKKVLREVERTLELAYGTVDDLENEVKKAPTPYSHQMSSKARGHREDLNKLSLKLRQLSSVNDVNFTRQELFAGEGDSSSSDMIGGQRTRLHQTNAILDRTSQSIARSHQVAIETEHIGNDVMAELGDQRETLIRARDNLSGTDANLSQSRKILKSMYQRVTTNKLILVVIILLEVGILVGVVYWKFFT